VRLSDLVRGSDTDNSVGEAGAGEDALPNSHVRIMFAERQGVSLRQVLDDRKDRPKTVIALIGPEGGWADDEIDQARAAGWKIVTLGGRVLRAETAAIVAATLIQHRFGDLT
jgi:16S rRNA (uracil1498-N3)-methyltransferase